ncbi:HEAT repeat domain-containing protein [Streptomyces sp. NRRL WC-3618]|uniref:HEAT repeat domain-containing protein n=1 Tax=Streptomyces sp. NRRL WC-3618 TaxID=1519490 RepID=UPI0006ADC134|nr:HEAT repeat domain-containing protein [Streptomyces sp. NRRL WC-3618]
MQVRKDSDGPLYALCVKAIQSLGEIGTPEANRFLKGIATSEPSVWPAPLRWHAAEELGIEDELGFDEDEMLGGL